MAEHAENGNQKILRNRNMAEVARAAEALVGTDRARELLTDAYFRGLKADIGLTNDPDLDSFNVMSLLQKMLNNDTPNKPLGSSLTWNEWDGLKRVVQGNVAELEDRGYTLAEIAAALAYGDKLSRGGAERKGTSSNTVTSYKTGKPEQVPRYFKIKGTSGLTKNTYTTKQFVPYAGIYLQANTMSYSPGRSATSMYRIADIHSGHDGAWIQSTNDGSGFAAGVYKDKNGWYIEHRRLGHEENGKWTERVYLEDLRKRIGF